MDTQIELYSHIVDIFIDVQPAAYLGIGIAEGRPLRESHQLVEAGGRAALLHIAGVAAHLELVYLVVAQPIVGIDVILIVGLAYVEHAYILSVDELMNGLIALYVDIHARRLEHIAQGSILQSGLVLVAAVAYLQGAVAYVGFLFEEGVRQVLVASHLLGTFQLERMGQPGTAPAATDLQLYILIEHHPAVGCEVREVHRALPVHVPVAGFSHAVAGPAVAAALHQHTHLVAIEETVVAHYRYHRQVVVAVFIYIGTRSDRRGQHAVGKEAEAIAGGGADSK